MKVISNLEAATFATWDAHDTLEGILADGRVTCDEMRSLQKVRRLVRDAMQRLDRQASAERFARRLQKTANIPPSFLSDLGAFARLTQGKGEAACSEQTASESVDTLSLAG